MLSYKLKLALGLLNFSPVFVILWFANITSQVVNNILVGKNIFVGIQFTDFYLLGYFLLCFFLCMSILKLTKKTIPSYSIQLKTIKSVDTNFHTFFISYLLPLAKLHFSQINDLVMLIISLILFIILSIISTKSLQFNTVLRIIGFKHYEVQTTDGLYLIVLSKELLLNTNQVKSGIRLTDYVILNSTSK